MTITRRQILEMGRPELEDAITEHNRRYWEDNAPTISDELYDLLVRSLEVEDPGSDLLNAIGPAGKVAHLRPMLSLGKCYTEEEIQKWFKTIRGRAVVTPKIDGMALSLRYDKSGNLVQGTTRGDGTQGDDVTVNARQLVGVPHRVFSGGIEVRGEAYMPLSVFREKYADQFANPRNLTAGALKQKDPTKTAAYRIHFFAYDIDGIEARTETDKAEALKAMGFVPPPYSMARPEGAQALYAKMLDERDRLDYETDGVVFKVNDIGQHAALGETAHHPRYAIAYKFQGDSGTSVLRDVEWSPSRRGSLNPVAIIDPVSLSGATVTRVSLHNLSVIHELGGGSLPRIGASLVVTRRGGVIPHIERITGDGVGEIIHVPDQCPHCEASVKATASSGGVLMADHTAGCSVSARKRLEHFSDVADIRGLGPKLIEQLYEQGLIRDIDSFYTLEPTSLLAIDRMGTKKAQNMIGAIQARRILRPSVLLRALGIPDLGRKVSVDLERSFPTMDAIRGATIEDMMKLEGVGSTVAVHVVDGLYEASDLLDRLLAHVTLAWPTEEEPTVGIFTGMSFVFTGAMEMSRKQMQKRVKELGGAAPSSVTKNTTHLVLSDDDHEDHLMGIGAPSAKLLKATAMGPQVTILSETDFHGMSKADIVIARPLIVEDGPISDMHTGIRITDKAITMIMPPANNSRCYVETTADEVRFTLNK